MSTQQVHRDDGPEADPSKGLAIVVNARQVVVYQEELSFDDVVRCAFDPLPTGGAIEFAITYRGGAGRPTEGILAAGGNVKVQDGTVFNVSFTDKS